MVFNPIFESHAIVQEIVQLVYNYINGSEAVRNFPVSPAKLNWSGILKQVEVVYKDMWTGSTLIYTAPSILQHYRDVL